MQGSEATGEGDALDGGWVSLRPLNQTPCAANLRTPAHQPAFGAKAGTGEHEQRTRRLDARAQRLHGLLSQCGFAT